MVADINREIIFQRKRPAITDPSEDGAMRFSIIGAEAMTVYKEENGDITFAIHTEASDLDPAHFSHVRLDSELRELVRKHL